MKRQKIFIKWSMTLKVIQGYVVYRPILITSFMIANIMKTQFFINVYFMLWRSFLYLYCWPEYNLAWLTCLWTTLLSLFFIPLDVPPVELATSPPASHRSNFLGRRVKVGEVGEILGYFIPCLLKSCSRPWFYLNYEKEHCFLGK